MTKPNKSTIYFVERLTLADFFLHIYPRCLLNFKKSIKIYFIDGAGWQVRMAQIFLKPFKISLDKFLFKLVDVRDEKGNLIRLRLAYFDFTDISDQILKNPVFQSSGLYLYGKRFPIFLEKCIANYDLKSNETLWRALLLVQIADWAFKKNQESNVLLFMKRKVWQTEINQYAKLYNISIIPVNNWRVIFFQALYSYLDNYKKVIRDIILFLIKGGWQSFFRAQEKQRTEKSLLSVEYYGHLNLDLSPHQSDLFFYRQSSILPEDILVTFHLPADPLNDEKWTEIKKHRLNAMALDARARTHAKLPTFYHLPNKKSKLFLSPRAIRAGGQGLEKLWIERQTANYCSLYNYWIDFFKQNQVKIYLSWYIYNADHCVIADALETLGGVTAFYQRAFCELPSNETRIASDIFFAFSKKSFLVDQKQRSEIPYYIMTGYVQDYLFSLVREEAHQIRQQLQQQGAKHIISYFDEGSAEDSRWHTGHEFMRVNYAFLLEKLLDEPDLGLVFKPKVPGTLGRRLGAVADLLDRAKKTGRCYVVEGGVLHGSYPPALAALASDVAIHGHLCAATAGIEAVLAGVPTLLLDREGWSVGGLYNLGEGQVVFKNWEHLWSVYKQYLKDPKSVQNFGNWSSMINDLDPFRDGRAAERIGTYLNWLLKGFKAKLPRETILADAAERYAKLWGDDKVMSIESSGSVKQKTRLESVLSI